MKKPYKNVKSYSVIGLGRFGRALAIRLAEAGQEVLVIDSDEEKVRELREYTENAYVVKTLDKPSLDQTGIQNCDVAIVCIGEKLDVSILTTLHLASLGIKHIIAKANSLAHGEILKKLGAEVVFPEYDMAIRLARRLHPSRVIKSIELSEKIDISKIPVPDSFIGKTIQDVNVRKNYGLNIIAVENPHSIISDLSPNYKFSSEDSMIVIGDSEKSRQFDQHIRSQ